MMFSIIIPTYNRVDSLISTLKKLELQTNKEFEVIIINDASTINYNETDWLQTFNEFPITYHLCKKNAGPASARNLGVTLAKYEWIIFLDDDDEFTNNKIEILSDKIKKSNFNFIYNKAIIFMVNENCYYETSQKNINKISDPSTLIKQYNFIGGAPNFTIKKDLFILHNGFNEKLKAIEDYEFLIRIINDKNIKVGFIEQPLTKCFYVTNHSSVSKNIANIANAGYWIMNNNPSINRRLFKSNLHAMLAHAELMSLNRKSSYHYLLSSFYNFKNMKNLFLSIISLCSPVLLIKLRCLNKK
ncbi:TPA: glycosyltransferase family A protein [Providencia stuartii]|uniref:glycosyltransferase family 2 protein n=1 Tax=Providencia stuartii TaxID=588 RepID=UPI002DB5FE10|nr:glycosyltransferase family A protein [Providencia stuartii]WRV51444.1 glycosyltransferase family A protein [Providencia stuartii]